MSNNNSLPQLCCPKCGSLDINPGMPQDMKKMPVYCNNCKELSFVNIKIEGVTEDGKMKVTVIPSLIMSDFNKDRTKKFYS